MARMLGACRRSWCPFCRGPVGLDCADVSRSKGAGRAREKRFWHREVNY